MKTTGPWRVISSGTWAPFQYPMRRLIVRSRKVSKPRDLCLEFSDRSEIWQAPRQHCCRCACQISKRCDNLNYQSRGFETSRDLEIRRLIRYWNGARVLHNIGYPYETHLKHNKSRENLFVHKIRLIVQSFCNFVQSTAVSLPCSVQNDIKRLGICEIRYWQTKLRGMWV